MTSLLILCSSRFRHLHAMSFTVLLFHLYFCCRHHIYFGSEYALMSWWHTLLVIVILLISNTAGNDGSDIASILLCPKVRNAPVGLLQSRCTANEASIFQVSFPLSSAPATNGRCIVSFLITDNFSKFFIVLFCWCLYSCTQEGYANLYVWSFSFTYK